jgi:gluconokinase
MSDHMAYIIGSDIGTSSTKSISLGIDGSEEGSFQQAYLTSHPELGSSEQDPDLIVQAVKDGIRKIVEMRGHAPAAICFSSAMHSLMAVDTAGRPLTPLIIWADNRSHAYAEALKATPEGQEIYRRTGTPVHAMSPLSKIIWLRNERQQVFSQTHKFLGIKEYVIQQLFGQYLTDHSIASATGLFDIHSLGWNALALAAAGIGAEKLPAPAPVTHVIRGLKAPVAAELGIPADTPFVIGGSDGCLAQLGSNALDAGHATLTIGTSGAVRMAGSRPITDQRERLFTYLLTDDVYITGGASNNGGVLLQWLVKDFLESPEKLETLVQQALALEPVDLICMPYLLGERAPIWDAAATAAFIGIRPQYGQAHFTRAVMESICFALLSIARALEETAGPIHKISVSGGFSKSAGWIQLLANIFGRTMCLENTADASAMGAIRLAADVLGLALPQVQVAGKQFDPDLKDSAHYQRQFRRFEEIYLRLKGI